MTVDQIRYFLEIAKCRSLLDASKNLHITQPTLSRQMSNIEKDLNVQLFFRTNHGMKLTPAGEVLQQKWENMMLLYEDAVSEAKFAFKGLTGKIKIGILSGLKINSFLPDYLDFMEKNYPNIEIILLRLSFIELTEKLVHGELDLAFSLDVEFGGLAELDTLNIVSYSPALLVHKRNPLYARAQLTFQDFEKESFAIVNRKECENGVDTIIRVFQQMGGFYPNLYYVDSMDTVNLWLESGQKCALLNDQMQIYDYTEIRKLDFAPPFGACYVQAGYIRNNDNFAVKITLNYFQFRDYAS